MREDRRLAMSAMKNEGIDKYMWADNQFNHCFSPNIGFTQLLSVSPTKINASDYEAANNRLKIIQEFQDTCIYIFRQALKDNNQELLHWLLNETPQSFAIDYHKRLDDQHFVRPVFFRTDEMSMGKIAEIQCPGSFWGELVFLHNFFKEEGYSVSDSSPADVFSKQLVDFLGQQPVVHYLIDNASAPAGVRYFIQQTRPKLLYWGIDKDIKAVDCNFVRTHSFFGLCGDNYFLERLKMKAQFFKYDFPPYILFDQKATLILPFWEKTRNFFTENVRNLIIYSTPLLNENIMLVNGDKVSLETFSKLPQSQRRYYLKYAGSDVSINWGSKAVYRLSNYSSDKCLKLLQSCLSNYREGKIWMLQKENKEKKEVAYWNRNGQLLKDIFNSKYSLFYGPFGLIGIVGSYRKHYKVHGQPETVIDLLLPMA